MRKEPLIYDNGGDGVIVGIPVYHDVNLLDVTGPYEFSGGPIST